jgi:hypothetical protein
MCVCVYEICVRASIRVPSLGALQLRSVAGSADRLLHSLAALEDQLQRAQMSRLPCKETDTEKDWSQLTSTISERETAVEAVRKTLTELRRSVVANRS